VIPKFSSLTGPQKAVYITAAAALFAAVGPIFGFAALAAKNMVVFGFWALALTATIAFWGPVNRILKTLALKLAKANARLNPIETLELDYQGKKLALDNFVEFVTSMKASQDVSQHELSDLIKKFPNRDLSDRQAMMDKMAAAVDLLQTKANAAAGQLKQYGEEIRFIKADSAWATRASKALQEMRAVQGDDPLDELLRDEAIGQVRQNVAVAFAELDMLLQQDDAKMAAALEMSEATDPMLIEGKAVEVKHFFDRADQAPAVVLEPPGKKGTR
jgi:hypothetical protein